MLDIIINERDSKYGSYISQSEISQGIKGVMVNSKNWCELSPCMKESLELIALKISRILNGDPLHKDSWQDICGYAELINKHL